MKVKILYIYIYVYTNFVLNIQLLPIHYRIRPNYCTVRLGFFVVFCFVLFFFSKILVLGKLVKYCPTQIKGTL